ncbi:MAG: cytochrome P460 family protein [Anaerolineae bacterium]|nr:cytochrome P460 family protein [Anaerolineae bacterium]
MIRTFFNNNRLTLSIAFAALVIVPLLAALVSSNDSTPASPTAVAVAGVAYPRNYRQDFTRYATVQRPDGTIRDLYINPTGLAGIGYYYSLPVGTVIVVEGYNALKNASGDYVTDANGHYTKADPLPSIHVREKRGYWAAADYTSSARNDGWNFGSFDTASGAIYNESLNACFLCHNTAQVDFTYSTDQMRDYASTGVPDYFMCRTTGRTACE